MAAEPPNFVASGRGTIDDETRATDRLQHLDLAIAALPSCYKEPLLLTAMDGLSHDQAAQILKISSKAVEMRIYRARQRLREAMGEQKPEG